MSNYYIFQSNGSQQAASLHHKFNETKNFIMGPGPSTLLSILYIFCIAPIVVSRIMANNNIDDINYGIGRIMVYLGRILPQLHLYFCLPIVTIMSNAKMKKTLLREAGNSLKDSWVAESYFKMCNYFKHSS